MVCRYYSWEEAREGKIVINCPLSPFQRVPKLADRISDRPAHLKTHRVRHVNPTALWYLVSENAARLITAPVAFIL